MSKTSLETTSDVNAAGMMFTYVKVRYMVVIKILSDRGSRKLPREDCCPGNFLAIHPSS